MKEVKVLAAVAWGLAILGGSILAGCGGSSPPVGPVGSEPTGSLVVNVVGLGEGRFVPPQTLSFKADVFPEGDLTTVQASAIANDPSGLVLSNVPAGPKDVRVWAYDAAGATGNGIAYGVAQVNILGGTDNPAFIHLQTYRLIFVSDRNSNLELYRATPDGRLFTRLTNNSVTDTDPSPSPNGQKIAYATLGMDGDYEIHLYTQATGAHSLFTDLTGDDRYPTWSPDSSKIAWVNLASGTYSIKIRNADGTGAVSSYLSGSTQIRHPAWSPDGSRIAFEFRVLATDDWEIGVMWTNGPFYTALTSDTYDQLSPVWRRDSNAIFVSAQDTNFEYQLGHLSGNLYPGSSGASVNLITAEPWNHWLGAVSPDGALLAYRANPPWIGNEDIYYYVLSPLYGEPDRIRVTYHTAYDEQPSFLRPTTGGSDVWPD